MDRADRTSTYRPPGGGCAPTRTRGGGRETRCAERGEEFSNYFFSERASKHRDPDELTIAEKRALACCTGGCPVIRECLIDSLTKPVWTFHLAEDGDQPASLADHLPVGIWPDFKCRTRNSRAEAVGAVRTRPESHAGLAAGGVPTAQGGRAWYPSTIRAVVGSRVKLLPDRCPPAYRRSGVSPG